MSEERNEAEAKYKLRGRCVGEAYNRCEILFSGELFCSEGKAKSMTENEMKTTTENEMK